MKLYFKILAVVAVVALIPLQYFLFANTYTALEKNLFTEVDESFKAAVQEEALIRYKDLNLISEIGLNRMIELLEERGSEVNTDTLSKVFGINLNEKNLSSIEYRIEFVDVDTARFSSPEDFSTVYRQFEPTFRELETSVVPINYNLSRGVKAVIKNPYKILFSKISMLLIFSMFLLLFVLYCLIKIWKVLSKMNHISKLRKDHTYAMIHDMKTPLTAINFVAEDIEDNLPQSIRGSSDIEKDIRILKEESEHLNQICDRVINVAKLESKKIKFVYEKLYLPDFLAGIVAKYQGKFKVGQQEKQVTIEVDTSNAEYLTFDKLYLKEILDNIIDNSIKYSSNEVLIQISSSLNKKRSFFNLPGIANLKIWDEKKYVEIIIKDNGYGIDPKKISRMFRKFERGENTTEISGHGLGLNYVYQLMKMQRGYIRIDSQKDKFTSITLGFKEI